MSPMLLNSRAIRDIIHGTHNRSRNRDFCAAARALLFGPPRNLAGGLPLSSTISLNHRPSGGAYVPSCAGEPGACRGRGVNVLGSGVAHAKVAAETPGPGFYKMEVTVNLTSKTLWLALLMGAMSVLVVGCDEDELRRLAKEAADRQAEQNKELVSLNREVAEGTRRLVAEDAASRKVLVAAHQQMQHERQQLSTGWNQLEAERKSIAHQRRQESLVAIGVREGGAVVLAILAITLACLMIRGARHHDPSADDLIDTLLVECGPDADWRHERQLGQLRAQISQRPSQRAQLSQPGLDVGDEHDNSNQHTEENQT